MAVKLLSSCPKKILKTGSLCKAKMDLLIIGGTKFLGRHLVDAASRRGHNVTLFNRGLTNPGLFNKTSAQTKIEEVLGDRSSDLASQLKDRKFDAVIDTCGYKADDIISATQALSDSISSYIFISSISVYETKLGRSIDEASPLVPQPVPPEEDNYATLKALCESTLVSELPDTHLIIRPGLIVGPFDPSDRFTYWVRRIRQGGKTLAPGDPQRPVQYIDVRDLAEWTILLAEEKQKGIYSAVGPVNPTSDTLSMGTMLDTMVKLLNADCQLVWASDETLQKCAISPWLEMPLWLPADSDSSQMMSISTSKSQLAGLKTRDLADTVSATNEWDLLRGDSELQAGLNSKKELQVLASL